MTTEQGRDIGGTARTIWELFNNRRYNIDTYQREYKWQTKQVIELLVDLSNKFLEFYESGRERSEVAHYGHYFLGSIILNRKNAENYIIDGQQRLTTLTLLLIYLNRRQANFIENDRVEVDSLIMSKKFGKKTFNIDVPERSKCLESLYSGEVFETATNDSEAIRNMAARYSDIEKEFPEEITDEAIPFFLDWLLNDVHLIEITTYSDDDAYTIFETMNDRGLSLAPLDMLKGFLLANIKDDNDRGRANSLWKHSVNDLSEIGKEEGPDFAKAWLRSQYADSIRERKRGAKPQDFDRLGTEFHRWVRDNHTSIGLKKSADFLRFIEGDFKFYTSQYLRLRKAALNTEPGLEVIRYNAMLGFTLQYPLLLAPIKTDDASDIIDRKIRVVATYLEIMLARRLWNFRLIAYSTLQYAMFLVMCDVRGKDLPELVELLSSRLDTDKEIFVSGDGLRMHQQNRYTTHWILARMTDWVGIQSGNPSHFEEYMAEGKNRYEIEHIWANHPEQHTDEFGHEADFREYRNRIGGLLLLPKSSNGSYRDLPYDKKMPHYLKQNLLAQSLHPQAYERNPRFNEMILRTGLAIKPHLAFKKADFDARHTLYCELAMHVWSPDRLEEAAR